MTNRSQVNTEVPVPSQCADPSVFLPPAVNRTVHIASAVNGDASEG